MEGRAGDDTELILIDGHIKNTELREYTAQPWTTCLRYIHTSSQVKDSEHNAFGSKDSDSSCRQICILLFSARVPSSQRPTQRRHAGNTDHGILEDCKSIRRRANGAVNVEWNRRQQERPLFTLGALLRQGLQIPQLANWQAKEAEEVLVQDYSTVNFDSAL